MALETGGMRRTFFLILNVLSVVPYDEKYPLFGDSSDSAFFPVLAFVPVDNLNSISRADLNGGAVVNSVDGASRTSERLRVPEGLFWISSAS